MAPFALRPFDEPPVNELPYGTSLAFLVSDPYALPLMSPLYNMREVCKQIVLLEDHLNHPAKRCSDCISKHFLTIEALIEEAVSLDKEGEHEDLLGLPALCRNMQQRWIDGEAESGIAQDLRKIRKTYTPTCFDLRLASFVADVYVAKQTHVCAGRGHLREAR